MIRFARLGLLVAGLLVATLVAPGAGAETSAQFAVLSARAPDDPNVNGLRFSVLQGKASSVRGVDFGLLSLSQTQTFSGAAFIFGISNVTGNVDAGATFALVSLHEGSDTGVNASFINLTNEVPNGMNFGFVNVASGHTMLDFGGYNGSKSSEAQIGFINFTDRIDGVQIGFLNFAKNGFFPVFPFVNFPKR